ncbi:MAG: nucleotide sugar dehydrogenase [Thermoplasmata archaeon]
MQDGREEAPKGVAAGPVAMVGFGYVGTILGAYLASRGFRVTAIESQPEVVRSLNEGKIHIQEAGLEAALAPLLASGRLTVTGAPEAIRNASTIILTVGTPLGRGIAPDLSALRQAARDIAPHLHDGQLVIVKSTVPPGTTRRVIAPLLEGAGGSAGKSFHLAYCPERLSEGNALKEVPALPVVVSGISESSARAAEAFWEAAGLRTIRVGTLEAGEIVKLADNVWIDVTVALTNELAQVCEALDVDALDVIRAANTLAKGSGHVNYLHPGIGVGGSCLTKDPWFFTDLAASLNREVILPAAGRRVNEAVPARVAVVIAAELGRRGPGPNPRVAVLGFAFKGSTGDTRHTPVRALVGQLAAAGCAVALHDPWIDADRLRAESGLVADPTIEACVKGASCVVIAANHPEFLNLSPDRLGGVAPGCFVYDGWHVLDPAAFVAGGIDYLSPGRVLRHTGP